MAIAPGVSAKGRTSSGTTVTSTAVDSAASGSTFRVTVIWSNAATFVSIEDNKGNSYSIIGTEINDATSGFRARRYYVENGTGGSGHTATLTISGAQAAVIHFQEITGGVTSGILDQEGQVNDTSSPFTLAAGETTLQDDELLVAFEGGNSGSNPATHAESTGFTIQTDETDGSIYWASCQATRVVSATGTYNCSFTESGGTRAAVFLDTFMAELVAQNQLAWIVA